jgi:ABC-type uncharacterized transport system auxiliary subunit
MFRYTPQTTYFDLGDTRISESKNYGIEIKGFSSDIPASTRMVFRKDSNEIEYDIYNNWAQTPQNILTKYLILYFNNPHKQMDSRYANKKLTIDGNIYNFECNMDTKEAVLNARIKIIQNETIISNKIHSIREKMAALTASDFSKAMAQAAFRLAQQIENDIDNLEKLNN